MLVSGGKVIAIDSIKKGNTNKDTLSGDGVWTNLGVNTDVIATTKKLNDTKSELESKINSASSALSGEIQKKQDELKFDVNSYGKITAIGTATGTTTALAGGSNVVVSAGANTRVDSATSGEQTIYTVNVTANPTNVTVSGEHGLSARRDNNTSAYYLGLSSDYIKAITSVSSKLDKSTFDSYTATADAIAYSAANNYIKITDHKISGYDWTNTITAASSNAVTTVESRFNGDTTSYSGYSGIPFIDNTTPKWSVIGDGNRISVTSANNQYGVSWNSAGFATEDWVLGKNYLPKDIASSTYLTIASAEEIYQKKLHAGSGIVIEDDTVSVEIYVSGDLTPYSAGEGIGIDNHIVSITADYLSANALKDLSGRWESAADALEASADNWNETYKNVSDSADKWNTTYERVKLSGDEWDKVSAKLDSATFKSYSALMEQKLIDLDDKNLDTSAFTAWSAQTTDWDVTEYSAGKGIGVDKHVISITADYLSANALDNLSGNWESTYKTVETNSAKWETAYETLTTNSADWDEVSAKLNSATFATYSADIKTTIETFSGEFVELSGDFTAHSADHNLHLNDGEREKWNSAANRVENSAAIWDTVSAKVNKTEFEEFKTSAHDELEKKLDKVAFESWSANKDYDFYSAGNGIKIENHIVSVSADYALSADVDTRLDEYYDKDEVDKLISNFGGYTTATSAEPDGHPDVSEIDSRRIYLVKMASGPTSADNYKEWIYIDTASAWNCVGETTMDLTPYLTKEEAGRTYQPIGDYVVSSTDVIKPGSAWVLVNDNDNVQWSGLDVSELGKKYIVKSTNGTIGIGSATVGNVITYDLSGATIVGENGVSAEFNPVTKEWNVGLEKTNLIAFGKFHSNINTYTTSAALTGFVQEDIVGDDIYLNEGKVYVNSGLYHIDIQVEVTVPGTNNEYYNTILKSTISPTRQIQQEIDGSYAHTETIDLSFDNRYAADDTELEFTIENLPTNASIYVKNLNIHRIICSLTEINGGLQYQAGDAIKIENNTINLDYGDGLELSGNKIQVKLGEGLKFDENAGVKAITINNEVEEVVETVTAIATDLDIKISNNFPPAMITVADADIAQYRNNGALYGTLFNVSINQAVEIDRSMIGMYIYRVDNNMNVVFGLYEYQPDYPRYIDDNPESGISAYGRTVPLCDTGVVQLTTSTKGFCEWPIKNLNKTIGTDNPETRPSLKSSCMYYATIYMGSDLQAGGLHIGSFSGYAPQFNDIKPGLTISNDNINCSLTADYSSAVSFNDFGFGWKYNNYAGYYAGTDNTYSTGNYSENNGGYRFYMQIRNKAKEA